MLHTNCGECRHFRPLTNATSHACMLGAGWGDCLMYDGENGHHDLVHRENSCEQFTAKTDSMRG